MNGFVMIVSLVLLFLLGCIRAFKYQDKECDEIFEDDCDPADYLVQQDRDCFDSPKKIEDALLKGDARQAFNDCDRGSSCDKYRGEGYVCVPYWACQNNSIITNGKGLIDVRGCDGCGCAETLGKLDATDTKCDNIEDVCCKNPNWGARKCDIGTKSQTPEEKATYAQCGRSAPALNITASFTISIDAQPGEYPHTCAVYRVRQGQHTYIAGASLIDKNKVVTAAHKFYIKRKGKQTDLRENTAEFYVRCGEHTVRTKTDLLEHQEIQVEEIILHPQYDEINVTNNLAILQTKQNFVYQKHIGPVCLPEPSQKFDKESDCWTSGWGPDVMDSDSDGFYSDRMRKVKMPVVTNEECQTRMKKTRRFKNKSDFAFHNSWVCVGGEKYSDTCKSVGGAPHVCKNSADKWVQVGALAWGMGCGATPAPPAVYSSIADGMCWIDWVMSCVPGADKTTSVEHLEGQGSTVDSRNKLTRTSCGDWLKDNGDLLNKCEVAYL